MNTEELSGSRVMDDWNQHPGKFQTSSASALTSQLTGLLPEANITFFSGSSLFHLVCLLVLRGGVLLRLRVGLSVPRGRGLVSVVPLFYRRPSCSILVLLAVSVGLAASVAVGAEALVQGQFQGVGLPLRWWFLCVLLLFLQTVLSGDGTAQNAEKTTIGLL